MNRKYIYTITVMESLDPLSTDRCCGWFHELKDAKFIVEEKKFAIHEGTYEYSVIERVHSGLYHILNRKEWWYKWDAELGSYVQIEKPVEIKNIIAFGIG